jgi:hypothetical protein
VGSTFGYRANVNSLISVEGRLFLQLDFATAALVGRTSNFRTTNSSDLRLDFQFNATVAPNWTFSGPAQSVTGGEGLTGNVRGSFFGPSSGAPEEVGLAYSMAGPTPGSLFFGVGAAGRNDSAAVPGPLPPPSLPPPPPPPPPAPVTQNGPSSFLTLVAAPSVTPGAPPGGFLYADGPLNTISVTIDRGATSATSDDTYRIRYSEHFLSLDQTFTNLRPGSDAISTYLATNNTAANSTNLFVFDLAATFGQTFDHVSLLQFIRESSTGFAAQTGFIAYGEKTNSSDIPTTGNATYAGGAQGYLVRSNSARYLTKHDLAMTANFATGAVSGSTSNFQFLGTSGLATPSFNPNFTFQGSLSGGIFSGSAQSVTGGLGLTGEIDGAFFGPPATAGAPPREAALSYALGSVNTGDGTYMLGTGVLKRTP